jgi:putative DNA methylase
LQENQIMKIQLSNKIISEVGTAEKYVRKEHFNTIKVWWARRPITSMRNLLIKEVLRRNNQDNVEENLVYELNPDKIYFKNFSKDYNTNNLSVLDVFSGGGSIPFESSRLGFKTYSSELNPIACLAQEAVFGTSKFKNYYKTLKKEGLEVIDKIEEACIDMYNYNGIVPYSFFWSRTMVCPQCHNEILLGKIKYFSKKKNRIIIFDKTKNEVVSTNKDIVEQSRGDFVCCHCGHQESFSSIKDYCKNSKLGDRLIAACLYDSKKEYVPASSLNSSQVIQCVNNHYKEISEYIPVMQVKNRGGVINPTLYDLKYCSDFYNKRQLVILMKLILTISDFYNNRWVSLYGEDLAKQLVISLTSLIEFLVDWNNKGTMWIAQNEQSGRSLAGPGVGMKWDYLEINPFFPKGSNLRSKLLRVCDTLKAISFDSSVEIHKGSSTNLPYSSGSIDIVLTDPPYYDSIDYTGLSDFFKPWFQLLINLTYDKKADLSNDESHEAIVDLHKGTIVKKDDRHYQSLMSDVLKEVKRVLKDNGACMLLYSHKTIEGWNTIAEAIKSSGLFIESTFPLEMERLARPRAMEYDALNGVIVFRLTKAPQLEESMKDDICNINNKLNEKEFFLSHLPIYLASLACKYYVLQGGDFINIYHKVISLYQEEQVRNSNNLKLDDITKAYLNARIKCPTDLSEKDFNELCAQGLIVSNKTLPLSEINSAPKNTILEEVVNAYKIFDNNTKSRNVISISDEALFVLSIINGTNLNTIKQRSSEKERKIIRSIVSKLS